MSKECDLIHNLFNSLKRYSFPYNNNELPLNGLYILFQRGESSHSKDRIVRVGTHTGKDQLPSRIFQHFVNENKDRSIFRKNIGRAILVKNNDSFIEHWDLDLTTKDAKNKHLKIIDLKKQRKVEEQVTAFLKENFSFIIIPVKDKDERLLLESKIISTISLCDECKPSANWLGNHSPKEKIKSSGLWQVNELWKKPLSLLDIEQIKEKLKP